MQAQLKQEDLIDTDCRLELDATKAELLACREQLESALCEVQEKAEHVDVMVSFFNDVVEGQLKPQLKEAETTVTQLREQVAALSTDMSSVRSQLTKETKEAEGLKEQVATLTSELKAAKAEVTAKDTAMKVLEDEAAALQSALHEKSRATADHSNVMWIWVCFVSLVVAVVVHAWSFLVAVMSWTWMLVMSACWRVKTWTKAVVATDKNDQDVKRELSFVGPMCVGLLMICVGVLVLLGVTTIWTQDGTLTHPVHSVTSGPLPWMPSGLVGDAMVVDGTSSVPLFADTIAFSPVDDGDETPDEEARRDDPEFVEEDANELVSRLGSMVATTFGIATTTAGCVLKVWVGWALVSSLVQLYAGCRSP